MEKGCSTCLHFDFLEGECEKKIATQLESRDFDTSKCTCWAPDPFCLEIEGEE